MTNSAFNHFHVMGHAAYRNSRCMGGKAVVPGHRIPIWYLLHLFQQGWSIQAIAQNWELETVEVLRALAYALENPEKIEVDHQADEEAWEKFAPGELKTGS